MRHAFALLGVVVLALGAAAPAAMGQSAPHDAERFYSNDPANLPEPQGKPPAAKDAMERDLLEAARLGAHSFYDTSKVPLDTPTPRALNADLPTAPSEDDLRKCLAAAPEAKTAIGWTYNRMFWCQELGFRIAYEKVDLQTGERTYKGTNLIRYQMVVAGTGTQRAVRVFFRPIPGSVSYPDWSVLDDPGSLNLDLVAQCGQESEYCSVAKPSVRKTWGEWNSSGSWVWWDIASHEEASDAPLDKIIFHSWRLRYDGTSLEYPAGGRQTVERPFRCDSATYFNRWGTVFDKGCVLTNVIPHLQYDISDTRVQEVARHIREAQDSPAITWPKESHTKNIPGKWVLTDPEDPQLPDGLHRVLGDSAIAKENTKFKNYACDRNGPYNALTGLPPKTPQQTAEGYQCDEYPFRSSEEGASNSRYDFSVKWVPGSQNGSAGGRLNQQFFFDDRILRIVDEFWVKINN
ncbi:hypothetical protein GCM10022419_062680 [Nonomuraea rosea]|uniref:Deoxyribonuclease NucA/NucB domain-containing protein n=2 Tax=Nonomuraea rosea TaxID=638574 RepID=A0ABP6XVI2_9ACTN